MTRGTLYIDGVGYEATDDMLTSLQRQMTFNDTAANTAGLVNALKGGEDLHYDSSSNVITGPIKWPSVDEKTVEGRKANQSRWRRIVNSTKHNDSAQFNNWLAGLSGFTYGGPKETVANDLQKLNGDVLHFKYHINDDGTKTYLADDADNLAIIKRLSDWPVYFKKDAEGRKGYNVTAWDDNSIAAMQSLYDKYNIVGEDGKNAFDTKVGEILERGKSGTLTPDDFAFLNTFRIVKDDDEAALQAEEDAKAKRALEAQRGTWATAGYGNYFDILHDYYDLDGDSLKLKAGVTSPYESFSNTYFNDDYYKLPKAATGEYDDLRGLTFYNGRFYNRTSPTLAKILNSENGFNAQTRAGNWNAAENIIATRHSNDPLGAPAGMPAHRFSTFFANNPRYFYSPNTGYQWLTDPTNVYDANGNRVKVDDTMQVVRYYDLDSPVSDGPYTTYANKYALLDEYGNFITNLDESAVVNLEESDPRYNKERGFGAYERVVSKNPYFNGRWIEDLVADDRSNSGMSLYHSPTDENDVLLYMQDFYKIANLFGTHRHDGFRNVAIKLPDVLLQAMRNNSDLWRKLEDVDLLKDFKALLSNIFTSSLIGKWPIRPKMKRLGFKDSDIENIENWYYSHNRQERMKYVIPNVPPREASMATQQVIPSEETPEENTESLKNGGVLKFGFGGSNEQKAVSATYTGANKYESTTTSGNLLKGQIIQGDGDSAELAAVLADIASLATSVAGLTPVSAATGAVGSTSRLIADLQRGEEKDAGWRYLIDLGFDAATLIPGLGIAAKAGKIKRYVPFLYRMVAAAGLGTAVNNSIKQLENGNFTLRDLDTIINGLSGAYGLRQSGIRNGVKKTTKVADVEIQGKVPTRNQPEIKVKRSDGSEGITLTKEELANVKTEDDLMKAIQAKTKSGGTELSKEKVKELYKFEEAKGQLVPEGVAPNKITLTEAELKNAKSQKDLEDVFLKKAKEADSSITDLASAKAKYDFDIVLEKGKKWHPGWSPKNWFRTTETTSWKPTSSKTQEAIEPSGQAFKDWWNGTGPRQQAFRDRINGKNALAKGPKEVKAPKELETQTVKPGDTPDNSKLWTREDLTQPEYVERVKNYNPEVDDPARSAIKGPEDFAETTIDGVKKSPQAQYAEYLADLRKRQALSEQFEKRAKWEAYRKEKSKTKAHNKELNDSYTAQKEKFNEYQAEYAAWRENKRIYDNYRKQWFMMRPWTWTGLESNQGETENDNSYIAYNPYRAYNPMVVFDKKGGKIPKFQTPGNLPLGSTFNADTTMASVNASKKEFDDWMKQRQESMMSLGDFSSQYSWKNNMGRTSWNFDPSGKMTLQLTTPKPKWQQEVESSFPDYQLSTDKSPDVESKGTNIDYRSFGGKNTKPFDYRTFGRGLINSVNALGRLQDSDKQVEITKSVAPYMQTATQIPQMAMTFSGAGDAYRNAGKQLQSYKDVSSDAIVNQLGHLNRDAQRYGNAELNANLADSKEIAANRVTNHELFQKQLAAWTEALNNNRYSWWTKWNTDANAETQGIAQKSAILNNLGYSAAKDFDEWAADKMTETTYPDYQADVMRIDNRYRKLLKDMDPKSQEYANLYQQWMAERNATQLYWGLNKSSLKKGGKITYSKDVGPELLLQSNKDTQAFLRKLSDNTQRLLLQIRKK